MERVDFIGCRMSCLSIVNNLESFENCFSLAKVAAATERDLAVLSITDVVAELRGVQHSSALHCVRSWLISKLNAQRGTIAVLLRPTLGIEL
eukprot:5510502-Amphidinium_carterae.1